MMFVLCILIVDVIFYGKEIILIFLLCFVGFLWIVELNFLYCFSVWISVLCVFFYFFN